MKSIKLDSAMKLMSYNNVPYHLKTTFIYKVPSYIYGREIEVICFLENNQHLYFTTSDSEVCMKTLENLLWSMSTYTKVYLQSNGKAVAFLKNDLTIR